MNLRPVLAEADALIVVPPFGGIDRPSLGAHVLQACAAARGFKVAVLNANILFAAEIGEVRYEAVCFAPTTFLLGERVFAAAAYGVPRLGRGEFTEAEAELGRPEDDPALSLDLASLQDIEAKAGDWLDRLAAAILAFRFPVVGCTTTFEQTAASIAILQRIKQARPEVVTVIGGANCDGEMADGIRSLTRDIDYVFSGECEQAFPDFLQALKERRRPEGWLAEGSPCFAMDALPTTDFSSFYQQLDQFLPDSIIAKDSLWLPYESSRGCWWGEKSHCTFCGINGSTMTFREKSPDRVIDDLRQLSAAHPTTKVCMVDNIMPHGYFKTLLPRLGSEVPGLEIFYEQKANLRLDQVESLAAAGVNLIQPGIEALATSLLRRMAKGVTGRQNLALLRYCRSVGVGVNWNLLYAFPGDRLEDYELTLELMPWLHHLSPPDGPCHLSIDRFSPYYNTPERFGITGLRPMASYAAVLPEQAEVAKVAYHFTGDYPSGSKQDSEIILAIRREIARWRQAWEPGRMPPALVLAPVARDTFVLADKRGVQGNPEIQFLDQEQAAVVLTGASLDRRAEVSWALERRLLVELDGCFVPLTTAPPETLHHFESLPTRRPTAAPGFAGTSPFGSVPTQA